jgi:hypothetical protein
MQPLDTVLGYQAASGYVVQFTGTQLAAIAASLLPLANNKIFVGSAGGVATAVSVSGDATVTNAGAVTVGSVGGKAVTLAGALTLAGAYSFTGTLTATTAVTFPTSGTLVNKTDLQSQVPSYSADTGTANAYVVTLSPVPASLTALIGAPVRFKAANACTGASTLNVNGLGAAAIKHQDGASALTTGDIVAGQVVEAFYDGTYFQIRQASSGGGVSTAALHAIPFSF